MRGANRKSILHRKQMRWIERVDQAFKRCNPGMLVGVLGRENDLAATHRI